MCLFINFLQTRMHCENLLIANVVIDLFQIPSVIGMVRITNITLIENSLSSGLFDTSNRGFPFLSLLSWEMVVSNTSISSAGILVYAFCLFSSSVIHHFASCSLCRPITPFLDLSNFTSTIWRTHLFQVALKRTNLGNHRTLVELRLSQVSLWSGLVNDLLGLLHQGSLATKGLTCKFKDMPAFQQG